MNIISDKVVTNALWLMGCLHDAANVRPANFHQM